MVRSTEESVKAIIDGLEWLGITWDEGPFFQSKRRELYLAAVKKLLDSGKAYKCYCTQEELKEMREKAIKEKTIPKSIISIPLSFASFFNWSILAKR